MALLEIEFELELAVKVPFGIGKPQLRPLPCETRHQGHAREEAEFFLVFGYTRAQETKQRRALFDAVTDVEETYVIHLVPKFLHEQLPLKGTTLLFLRSSEI